MKTVYDPYEIKLAREIAEALNDLDSITAHLQCVRMFQEAHLRGILAKVMSIPEHKIKKSRAALYMFLVNQSKNHGDTRH